MEIWLVKGTVCKTEYMGDEHRFDDVRLVKAWTSNQAREKFEQFWESKTDEYSVYYRVGKCEVKETIL
jgi:hypothetical protein